jgi:hypothetical protein
MSELTGWTKVGDKIEGKGKWVVYRLKKGLLPTPTIVGEEFEPTDAKKALREYQKRATEMTTSNRSGGLWLVNPEGVVASVVFIAPQMRFY